MKTKQLFFVFVMTVFALLLTASVKADLASDIVVKVNNDVVDSKITSVTAGETIDLDITFRAIVDEKDVRVKVWIDGYRDEVETETVRFDVINNRTYTRSISLKLPLDLNVSEDYKIIVRVASRNREDQKSFQLTVQRPSYNVEILSADFIREIEAGKDLLIDVVVKNRGGHKVDDNYITARIAELGISKRAYASDLVPVDCEKCDFEDAVEKTVVLSIPKNTKSGTYDIEIVVENRDAEASVKKQLTIKGVEAQAPVEVLARELSKEVVTGGKEVYKIEVLNPSSEAKIITIATPSALEKAGIKVKAEPSVITVPANSVEVVEVSVEADKETSTGNYTVPISIGSDGTTKQVGVTANVVKVKAGAKPTINTKALLTTAVVLGILLVVLVIVLFVTVKKPEKMGEEETAYY